MTSSFRSDAPHAARHRTWSRWLPDSIALAGIAAYGILAYGQVHGQASVLDEGLYLVKGFLFAQGVYRPFQDYGPLTNHMPLAFLIPGWVQMVWGEGIRTGRFYALALGVVMMILLWRTCRREGSPAWSVVSVWAVPLNASLVKIYSQAISQVLVITLIMSMLYLGLGGGRKVWQTTVAAALAGALWMTRINLLPVLPLLIGYLWLSHGRRVGFLAGIAGGGIVVLGHAIYWPEILKLWAKWLPRALTPFLDSFRDSAGGIEAWGVRISAAQGWGIVIDSFRKHLLPLAGAIWAGLSFPGASSEPEERQRTRDALFLGTLLVVLTVLHGYATLGLTYCPYCLMNYLGFFSPIGLVLLAIAGAHWPPRLSRPRRIASLAFLILIPFAAGLTFDGRLADSVLSFQLPRASLAALRPGTIELGDLVSSSIGLSRTDSAIWLPYGIVSAAALCLAGISLAFLFRRRREATRRLQRSATTGLLVLVLAAATIRFGNTYSYYDCGLDVIQAEEAAGADLQAKVTSSALLYWGASGLSPVPLLYLDNPRLFPPQLNGIYTFRLGGEPAVLHRFSYWSQALAEDWLAAADFVLVDVGSYGGWLSAALASERYDEILRTPPTNPCRADSAIMIFRRVSDGS
ncbi:MAG: hypothetical protein A2W34_00855 [Chloroflexi bacterium RBG_16_64_32]|nr:MAG: hypothetical protein A2W34_00855 [Chloroflexi bacterium RBG_16_64_32]